MRIPTTVPWLIAALLLGGCGTPSGPSAGVLLAGAHASLADDDAATAREWLVSAEPTLDTARQRKEYEMLMAEVDLRTGQADLALPAMNRLLAWDPGDPRAHEIAGKAGLMLGDYADAQEHFSTALSAYEREQDVNRAADLLALAQGFEEYARGRHAAAEEAWAGISDRRLRTRVLASSAETIPNTGPANGTLARTDQPER